MSKKKYVQIKNFFVREISLAKQNNFCAVLLPLETEYDPYYLDTNLEIEEIYEIGNDLGWDRFYLINFKTKIEQLIDLYTLEVA
ncbi:MAG TPA: hypothetical protein ENK66_08530 [Arcobacter sp.]|jgi:hypothetical protein|nr:hypothetical protein [Arcobacter sp.]